MRFNGEVQSEFYQWLIGLLRFTREVLLLGSSPPNTAMGDQVPSEAILKSSHPIFMLLKNRLWALYKVQESSKVIRHGKT